MAKKSRAKRAAAGRSRQGKQTPSSRRKGAGSRAAAKSGAGSRRKATAKRNTGRRTAGARTPAGKAARSARGAKPAGSAKRARRAAAAGRRGGTGRERELAQTAETGRSVKGRTNPNPTRRSTGTPSGAGDTRRAPGMARAGRRLREVEENIPTPPSSLDLDRDASAARSGRQEMRERRAEHTETSPVLTGGDVDANWQSAYAVGDEAPGGDNPTPDQDRVDEIGRALGVEYQDNEELRPADKVGDRDRHRWELDPASSEDYRDRD